MLQSRKIFRPSIHQKLTNHAREALLKAERLAQKFKHAKIDNLHLLYTIYTEKGSVGSNILKDIGINTIILQRSLEKMPTIQTNVNTQLITSDDLKKTFTRAYSIAKDFKCPYIGTEHLVSAIFDSKDEKILQITQGVDLKNIHDSIAALLGADQIFDLPKIFIEKNSAKKSSATPFIDKFCVNLNAETQNKSESFVGREKEIQRTINILGRKTKNNPVLIGEAGVGKTALAYGLAQIITSDNCPEILCHKKIMSLDVAQLIAGANFRGEFESRLKEIVKEITQQKNIILFIDELHTIVGSGNVPGSLDLANILKPALAQGEIQIIGATTPEEYKKYIEKDAALERRFQPILIAEPGKRETEKILLGIKKNYETFHNVIISDEIIRLAITLSIRYIQNRFLPDKAIDIIDEAASHIKSRGNTSAILRQIRKLENEKISLFAQKEHLINQENYENAILLRHREKELENKIRALRKKHSGAKNNHRFIVTADDVFETVAKISKIPAEKISQSGAKKIENIQKVLASRIIGQEDAIKKVTGALFRSQAGVSNPNRPLGSFLFLGPTGTGKTLTAQILAQEFFSSSEHKSLIRIDMSELMERHSISSLIGSPAGYIGYGEGGRLTEKVRRNPYSVILFDEIEKAHPDIANILLQILEDGILTDTEGYRVSFKNTIIILTSNLGSNDFENIAKIGFAPAKNPRTAAAHSVKKIIETKNATLKKLEEKMRPELLNRLDHILVFNSLGEKEIKKITAQELAKLTARLSKRKISLIFADNVVEFIAQKSVATNQGARLIRKKIQEFIEDPIARHIIYNKVSNNTISIVLANNKIKLT